MLNTPGPGGITAFSVSKAYYSNSNHPTNTNTVTKPNYDSSFFSMATDSHSRFQMDTVSRLSREARTTNTTGRIQELRQAVSVGTYRPDATEIAKRMLFLAEV